MNRSLLLAALFVLSLVVSAPLSAADAAAPKTPAAAPAAPKAPAVSAVPAPLAPGEVGLTGTFNRGKKGAEYPLQAVFTPTGAGEWKAAFNLNWSKKPMVFTGTVKGDPRNGDVTGNFTTGNGKRTWRIAGTAKDGALKCDHFETTKGDQPTGNLVLKPQA